MDRNFNKSLQLVLKHEGGFVNHKDDPGGATNLGITLANFRRYIKPDGTVAELKKLTKEQAATCYRQQYWNAIAGAELPDGVDFAAFDFAVNSGPARAAKYLQAVAGVIQDGRLGPASIDAIKAIPHGKVINDLCDRRLAFLKSLKTWGTFGTGWSRRVRDVRSEALEMAARPTPEKPSVIQKFVEVPVEVEKKVVPERVDKAVTKVSRNWLGGLGAGGFVTSLFGYLDDFNIQLIGIGIALAVAGFVIYLLLGPLIIRRIKAIRAELEAE